MMNQILTHLKPSTVCNGVGVFALHKIPADTILFDDVQPDTEFFKWDEVKHLGNVSVKYLSSMCNSTPEGFYLNRNPSEICIPYYINHSENPNVHHNLVLDRYITLRDIEIGEELLCEYNEYEIDW